MKTVSRRGAMKLVAAAGALALAAPAARAAQKGKVNKEEPVHSKSTADEHGPRQLFAVVDESGRLKRGMHVAGVRHLGDGLYEVVFRRDVRRGAYTATLGGHSYEGLPPVGYIGVVGRSNNPRAVLVSTVGVGGSNVNMGFHLQVICPEGYA